MNQKLKQHGNILLLPYFILLLCLFIPCESKFTLFRMDETSIEISPFGFKTALVGYESKIILSFLTLTLFLQLISFTKKSFFSEFLILLLSFIYLFFSIFIFFFHSKSMLFGFYFCLSSSAFIFFFNLVLRFGRNSTGNLNIP